MTARAGNGAEVCSFAAYSAIRGTETGWGARPLPRLGRSMSRPGRRMLALGAKRAAAGAMQTWLPGPQGQPAQPPGGPHDTLSDISDNVCRDSAA